MISNEVVLNKMMKELQTAIEKADNHKAMLDHIANIKLLTELFLEKNGEEHKVKQDISASRVTADQIQNQTPVNQTVTDQDGTSIFDF